MLRLRVLPLSQFSYSSYIRQSFFRLGLPGSSLATMRIAQWRAVDALFNAVVVILANAVAMVPYEIFNISNNKKLTQR